MTLKQRFFMTRTDFDEVMTEYNLQRYQYDKFNISYSFTNGVHIDIATFKTGKVKVLNPKHLIVKNRKVVCEKTRNDEPHEYYKINDTFNLRKRVNECIQREKELQIEIKLNDIEKDFTNE